MRTHVSTNDVKRRQSVIVIVDSLLRGNEVHTCCLDNFSREVFRLPETCIWNIKKGILAMIKPDDYYPLLVFQSELHNTTTRKLKIIKKKDFVSLGKMLKNAGKTTR